MSNEYLFATWYAWDVVYDEFYFFMPADLELEEEWELHTVAPSPDELAEMNATASELMTEFELV